MVDYGLKNRRIIVTGGASGQGAGLVAGLSAAGAKVVSFDVTVDAGEEIAAAAGALFVRCDVANTESVDSAFAIALEHLGGLDVLIHAAGISPAAPSETTPLDLWNTTMAINATGTFLTNQAAFAALKEHGGRIINFASAAGAKGLASKAAYAASKGAVLAWSRTVAAEWGRYGITVNSICPAIWTPMYDKTRSELTPEQLAEHDRRLATQIPLGGKLGAVEDLVNAVSFVASDGAKFITGQTIAVDGGSLMVR